MIKAIVYTSNTGHTKKYAEMLSGKINLPIYNIKEASSKINKNDEVIYLGWILAGGIKDFEKARKMFSIKAVCAVGMASPTEKQKCEIIERHHIKDEKFFYLQGGFDINELHGIYKFMMKVMGKVVENSLKKKDIKTEEDIKMLYEIKNGSDYVSENNLDQLINWIKGN